MRKLLLSLFLATISSSAYSAAAFPMGEDESSGSASSLVRGSLEFIEFQADNGDPDAQARLAFMFHKGIKVEKDADKAIHYALMSAEQGCEKGELMSLTLSHFRYQMHKRDTDLSIVRKYAEILEEKAIPEALLIIGNLYLEGAVFDRDIKRAEELINKAKVTAVMLGSEISDLESGVFALVGKSMKLHQTDDSGELIRKEWLPLLESGAKYRNPIIDFALGLSHIDGKDKEDDLKKARECFEKAAQDGHLEAKAMLGLMCESGEGGEEDFPKARRLLEESAEKSSNLMARFMLAMMRNIGEGGEKSPEKARLLLESYVDKKHKKSLAYLAYFYYEGVGGEKNYDLARTYFEEAIDELTPYQHGLLAIMYFNSWGGDKKMEKVRHHLKIAADETGLPEMEHDLGSRYYRGEGGAVDHAEAFKYFSRAAEKEWGPSLLMLGIMHLQGQTAHGVNIPLGMTYIERAAVKGVPMAGIILQQLRLDMRN
tara:strand:- start:3874 stop:5328 length:1455 start_codon:yes stop_codon:yes gene_type:complete